MTLKELFEDDGAVSPVIGVILMVAITVILAAVIGTFVLGLGDSLGQNAPTASFSFSESDGTAGNDVAITISHDGGDSIPAEQLIVECAGTTYDGSSDWSADTVTAGTTHDECELDEGDTVKIIWQSEDGGTSQTLDQHTA